MNHIDRMTFAMAVWLGCSTAPLADQVVFLDFEGLTPPPANSSAMAGAGGKKPFDESGSVTKFIDPDDPDFDTAEEVAEKMMDDIKAQMEADYAGLWIEFTKTQPTMGDFSALDFASNVAVGAGVLGTVDTDSKQPDGGVLQIDRGNMNKNDAAWIMADEFANSGPTFTQQQITNEMANVGSHEMAHLLGLVHDDGNANSLMGTNAGITYDGVDKAFTDGSKAKLGLTLGLKIGNFKLDIKPLLDAVAGLVSIATAEVSGSFNQSVTMDYFPGPTGPDGGVIFLNSPLSDPLEPFVRVQGGTVTGAGLTGLAGPLFGINDPFQQFQLLLPPQLDVIGVDPLTDAPILAPFLVDIVDPADQLIMQLQLQNMIFDPAASLLPLPPLHPDDGSLDDPFGNPDPAEIPLDLPIPGFLGEAFPIIPPQLLGQGSYLDVIAALFGDPQFATEFVLSTNLADATNGFLQPGFTDQNSLAYRLLPLPPPFLLGDADGDGDVDGDDLIAVQTNFGLTGPFGLLGDADGDGDVDGDDLIAVQTNFGSVLLPPSAVPEPTAAALLVLATLGLARRRRRS